GSLHLQRSLRGRRDEPGMAARSGPKGGRSRVAAVPGASPDASAFGSARALRRRGEFGQIAFTLWHRSLRLRGELRTRRGPCRDVPSPPSGDSPPAFGSDLIIHSRRADPPRSSVFFPSRRAGSMNPSGPQPFMSLCEEWSLVFSFFFWQLLPLLRSSP